MLRFAVKSRANTNIRRFCSSRISRTGGVVGPPLSKEQIVDLLSKPTWNVKEFLDDSNTDRAVKIDSETVKKLLQLSGLEASDVDHVADIIKMVKEQVKFVDHLHSAKVEHVEESHELQKPLTLTALKEMVKEQRQSESKGEVSDSWNPLSLSKESKNGHYIVREGLIKDK